MAAHIVRFGRFLARVCLLPMRRADHTLRPQATGAPPKLPVTPSRLRPYSTDEISSARRPAGYGMGRDNPLTKALFWHPKGGSGAAAGVGVRVMGGAVLRADDVRIPLLG